MRALLVQSPDTLERVVATRVCLQHLGSRSRFAHVPRIFRERTRWASYCRLFSFRLCRSSQNAGPLWASRSPPFDLQHAADPSDVKFNISTIRRFAVAESSSQLLITFAVIRPA